MFRAELLQLATGAKTHAVVIGEAVTGEAATQAKDRTVTSNLMRQVVRLDGSRLGSHLAVYHIAASPGQCQVDSKAPLTACQMGHAPTRG